jgi:transcriptional regulator of aroF, aroG, tyrA and aromatic amino acid transport
MRIEVFCEDRLGLARELLDLLVSHRINLRGIEIYQQKRIYLNIEKIDFELFRTLMVDIRRIDGVSDVKTVHSMPSEQESHALKVLVESITDPIFSIDLKGRIELANPAARTLLNQSAEQIYHQSIGGFINGYNFSRDLNSDLNHHQSGRHSQRVTVKGQHYLMDINPVYVDEYKEQPEIAGAVLVLHSVATLSYQKNSPKRESQHAFDHVIAVSPKMNQVVSLAKKSAKLNAPLLISGDTGTGKDIIALACHSFSERTHMPFLALNCAALPDEVVESELYGHAAGAYPNALEDKKGFFELANGGSVLLDEIGEMSPRMQSKLLRFLSDGTFRRVGEEQEVHVDVRVICATQRNLIDLVNKGLFREDLYYRLNVLSLQIPPLRERIQDIMPLTELFVTLFADEQGLTRPTIAADVAPLLTQYGWPGNVRQLKNVIYRALMQLEDGVLRAKDISLPELEGELALNSETMSGTLDDINKRFERSVLTQLYSNYPSTRKLAKRLGVSHTAIANKLREYGLNSVKHESGGQD